MKVFAFFDLDHPPVAWAVMRGLLFSADYAHPARPQGFISFMQAGLIEYQNNARLYNELIVEHIRQTSFGYRTSRLRGMYFFLSKEEAESRIGDQNWPRYFRADGLLELELDSPDVTTIVDANWITFARRGPDGRLSGDLEWIARYWAGETFDEKPVWELVANGIAIVLDSDVRRRCFEYVKKFFLGPIYRSLCPAWQAKWGRAEVSLHHFYCDRAPREPCLATCGAMLNFTILRWFTESPCIPTRGFSGSSWDRAKRGICLTFDRGVVRCV